MICLITQKSAKATSRIISSACVPTIWLASPKSSYYDQYGAHTGPIWAPYGSSTQNSRFENCCKNYQFDIWNGKKSFHIRQNMHGDDFKQRTLCTLSENNPEMRFSTNPDTKVFGNIMIITKTDHAPNNCYHQWDLLQISSSSSSSLLAKLRFAMSRFWFLEFTFREHYAFGTWLYMRRRRLCWLCNSKSLSFFLHDPNTLGHFTASWK